MPAAIVGPTEQKRYALGVERGRSIRRIVTRLIVFVLLGAVVNIAVAWGIRLANPNPDYNRFALPVAQARALWESHVERDRQRVEPITSFARTSFMRFSAFAQTKDDVASPERVVSRSSVGWPMPAMYGVQDRSRGRVETLYGIWRVGDERLLPVRPLWPGFAINTIFNAAILWLLFAAPGLVRRRRRIKRGLCPACAYPVGSSETCTECGKPVPTKCVAPT